MDFPKKVLIFLLAFIFAAGLFAQDSGGGNAAPAGETLPASPANPGGAAGADDSEEGAPSETEAPLSEGPSALDLPVESSPAPVVSGLRGEVKNNLLRLSWVDSPHATGPVYIYRSQAPIESADALAMPRQIPYGMQSYIDEFDESGTYYYLVIASDEAGQRFDSYILPDNSISVRIDEAINAAAEAPAPQAAPALPPEKVSALTAAVENNRVVISFRAGAGAGRLVLYRSIRPIEKAGDILGAAIIQSNAAAPVYDSPVPGIPYYYAVIPGEDLAQGAVVIKPGVNATSAAVEIAAETNNRGQIRTVPLPLIVLPESPNQTPETSSLSPAAGSALSGMRAGPQNAPPAKTAVILNADRETPTGGEEYLLAAIVQGAFASGDWTAAADEFTRFLAIPRSNTAEARARFYRGQCLFFTGKPRDALFEFLSCRALYPAESGEWIQAVLSLLTE